MKSAVVTSRTNGEHTSSVFRVACLPGIAASNKKARYDGPVTMEQLNTAFIERKKDVNAAMLTEPSRAAWAKSIPQSLV